MPVLVEVCLGTTCFVMGGQEILALEDSFPDTWRGAVQVKATACLGQCDKKGQGHGPYVRLDGEIIRDASPDAVMAKLEEKLHIPEDDY